MEAGFIEPLLPSDSVTSYQPSEKGCGVIKFYDRHQLLGQPHATFQEIYEKIERPRPKPVDSDVRFSDPSLERNEVQAMRKEVQAMRQIAGAVRKGHRGTVSGSSIKWLDSSMVSDLSSLTEGVDYFYMFEARFETYGATIAIHALHYAASLGYISALRWILALAPGAVNCRAKEVRGNNEGVDSYTPLLSALWMSRSAAAMFLLENGADVRLESSEGNNAWHILARQGLHNEVPSTRKENLVKVALELYKNDKIGLSAKTDELKHRTDSTAAHLRCKTPLELASYQGSQFPMEMLHLLSQSYHSRCESKCILKEMELITHPTKGDPAAATVFLSEIIAVVEQFTERLVAEINDLAEAGTLMDSFNTILMQSAVAAGILLKCLLVKPHVHDSRTCPLPLHACLKDGGLKCAYEEPEETDAKWPLWKEGIVCEKKWKDLFSTDNPNFAVYNYDVEVRVLYMPGVLNVNTLKILSTLQMSREQMSLFTQLPVAAIVAAMWKRVWRQTLVHLFLEILLLFILLSLTLWPHEEAKALLGSLIGDPRRSIIVAYFCLCLLTLGGSLLRCRQVTDLTRCTFIWYYRKGTCFNLVAMVLYLLSDMHSSPHREGDELKAYEKVVIALNVVARFQRLLQLMCGFRFIGPLIIAVIKSFSPMFGMFAFMGVVFAGFSCLFIIFKDEQRSLGVVILYLFETLILSNDGAALTISGLDIVHEQTADFGFELYDGGGQTWLLYASACIALLGMTTFSIVFLNLTIGMYTNYYDKMQPMAWLFFFKHRCTTCVSLIMEPEWQLAAFIRKTVSESSDNYGAMRSIPLQAPWSMLQRAFAKRRYRKISSSGQSHSKCECVLFFLAISAVVLLAFVATRFSFIRGPLLAVLTFVSQVIFVLPIADVCDRTKDYLWICYRRDYDEHWYKGQEEREIDYLQKQVGEINQILSQKMDKLLARLGYDDAMQPTRQSSPAYLLRTPHAAEASAPFASYGSVTPSACQEAFLTIPTCDQ